MMKRIHLYRQHAIRLVFTLLLSGSAPTLYAQHHDHDHDHDHPHVSKPSDIIRNDGQWGTIVDGYAGFPGGSVYFEANRLHFDLMSQSDAAAVSELIHTNPAGVLAPEVQEFVLHQHYYQVEFLGANAETPAFFTKKKPQIYNFFLGDRSTWRSRVGAYGELFYNNIYPGIGVVYKIHGTDLKYDFIVAANSDPSAIRMSYSSINGLRLDKEGMLVIGTSVGEQREYIPLAYQEINGQRVVVPCEYRLQGSVVSFEFPRGYDRNHELVIDPQLVASTNSGSTAMIFGHTATYDAAGNIFVGGNGFPPGGLPTTPGAYQSVFGGGNDMTLNKYNADGTQLVFSTFLGASGTDLPHSMVTGTNGDLYVLGSTQSNGFPVSAGAAQSVYGGAGDIAITHLSADGTTLVGSTFFGGSQSDGTNQIGGNYGDSYRGEINIAANGDVLISSFSRSNNFPVTTGAYQTAHGGQQDGVVARFNSTLSTVVFATYFGGGQNDSGYGIVEAPDGTIYVSGSVGTAAFTFPGTPAQGTFPGNTTEAVGLRFSADGQTLLNGTYVGNYGPSQAFFIQLDPDNNPLLLVQSQNGIPTTAGKFDGAGSGKSTSVVHFAADFSTQDWVSSLDRMAPSAFLVDHCGRIYASGHGLAGFDYATTPDAFYTNPMGFYLFCLDETATTLLFGTHYGNGGSHVDGGTSRFDANGIIYQATCSSGSFPPGPNGSYSANANGTYDMTVFKIDFEVSPAPYTLPDQNIVVCDSLPQDVTFTGAPGAGVIHHWWFHDGTTSSDANPVFTYDAYGTYQVTYYPEFFEGCEEADTMTATVEIVEPEPLVVTYDLTTGPECEDSLMVDIDFTGVADSISWDFDDGFETGNQDPFTHYYDSPGEYDVTLYAAYFACNQDTTVTFTIEHYARPIPFTLTDEMSFIVCDSLPEHVTFSGAPGSNVIHHWWFHDGTTSSNANPEYAYTSYGDYEVTYYPEVNDGCPVSDTLVTLVHVIEPEPFIPTFSLVQSTTCDDTLFLSADFTGTADLVAWDFDDGFTTNNDDPFIHYYTMPGVYDVLFYAEDTVCNRDTTFTIQLTHTAEQGAGELFMPNVFTGNQDGFNDTYEISSATHTKAEVFETLEYYSIQILNRWGNLVFESSKNDPQTWSWDGRIDGVAVDEGVYFYLVEYKGTCIDGVVEQHGFVHVVRE